MARILRIPDIGEPYYDCLMIEAFIKQTTLTQEARSLICSALMRRKDYREAILAELATKRGISVPELKRQILTGTVQNLEPGEWVEEKPPRRRKSA